MNTNDTENGNGNNDESTNTQPAQTTPTSGMAADHAALGEDRAPATPVETTAAEPGPATSVPVAGDKDSTTPALAPASVPSVGGEVAFTVTGHEKGGTVNVPRGTTVKSALEKLGLNDAASLNLRDSTNAVVSLARAINDNTTISATPKKKAG